MSYNPNNPRPVSDPHYLLSNYSPKTRLQITFPENSPYTKQEFRDECDINLLMSRYMATGEIPPINQCAPQYLDVTGIDYQESMNFVTGAQSLFNELPSAVRNRFQNDPAQFLDFCSNPDNTPEMHEMGLLRPDYVPPNTSAASAASNASQAKFDANNTASNNTPSVTGET